MNDLYLLLWIYPKDKRIKEDLKKYTFAFTFTFTEPNPSNPSVFASNPSDPPDLSSLSAPSSPPDPPSPPGFLNPPKPPKPPNPPSPLGFLNPPNPPKPSDYLLFILKKSVNEISSLKDLMKSKGIKYITIKDPLYPKKLKGSLYAPLILSYVGDFHSYLDSLPIAMIGSRRIDPELEEWIYESFKTKYQKYIYVSGGAIGVDQAIHKACLKSSNKTLIVLPSGLLNPYPKNIISDFKNFRNVIFISHFPPKQKVFKSNFYSRNHFMASLSDAVVVLQAEEKSGTLMTVKYALEMNKDVYALSCSPWNKRYSGNAKLISDGADQIINLDLFQ